MSAPFRYAQGATISLSGNVKSGDPTGWTGEAELRLSVKDALALTGDEPVAATFVVTFVAAVDPDPAYYLLEIDAVTSEALAAGYYLADIRLSSGANVAYSALVPLQVYIPATRP